MIHSGTVTVAMTTIFVPESNERAEFSLLSSRKIYPSDPHPFIPGLLPPPTPIWGPYQNGRVNVIAQNARRYIPARLPLQ